MEHYLLKVEKTKDGLTITEESDLSDFEVLGLLTHLVQARSLKLTKQLQDYENEKDRIEG